MKNFENYQKLSSENSGTRAEGYVSYLEKPAQRLLSLLRENLDRKEYDSVLGDDAGGRIHALLLGSAIKEIYGDEKKLNVIFVKGGRLLKSSPEHVSETETYLERMKDKIGKRTLVVTEEILGGHSVGKIASMLRGLGIEADIATFQTAGEPEDYEGNPMITFEGFKIFNGEGHGSILPDEYSGVWSDEAGSGKGYANARQFEKEQGEIKAIREAIKPLSHKLASEFLTK